MTDSSKAVFLSYTAQDADPARRLCEALRGAGVEVWFDQSELRGGDAWDAAIRRQIKACALFIPILSHHSHERVEGYFRLEWKLAVDRSHLMAAERPFLVPVVVDDLDEVNARVPDRFRDVQWTRLADGVATAPFVEHVQAMLGRAAPGSVAPARAARTPVAAQAVEPPVASVPAPGGSGRRLALAALALVVVGLGAWGLIARGVGHGASPAPYSPEDRRMTFAVLPLEAPSADADAVQVASAVGDAINAAFEANTLWNQVVPRQSVTEAVAKHSKLKDLARALDVHFLIRGHVARVADGYTVQLYAIDGASERVLGTQSLAVPNGALVPAWAEDTRSAVYDLSYASLQQEVRAIDARPVDSLDVRDLTYRAYVSWRTNRSGDAKGAYEGATALLNRALKIAPDDRLVLYLTAAVNLCDCVEGWSKTPEVQIALGSDAMEKYLRIDPQSELMLSHKADVYLLRGRYEDALIVADSIVALNPQSSYGVPTKAVALLKLGRAQEALALAQPLFEHYGKKWPDILGLRADIDYALGDWDASVKDARRAIPAMDAQERANPVNGPVQLTLVAAEARLGHAQRATSALADFHASVPGVDSIAKVKTWMRGNADLASYEPLYAGLRLAGMPD